jgi:ubiquinol-cytochrome c reductase cytochrome b subunit
MSLWGEFCLKYDNNNFINNNFYNISILQVKTAFLYNKIKSENRIGPHNFTILSLIFGSLLGDAYGEFRKQGKGTRISFMQESSHLSYIFWLHKFVSDLGYCNSNIPKTLTRLGKLGKVRKYARFHTWTYSSFNWIHELWYKNGVKVIPNNIEFFLTPLAFSIWIMDDGSISSKGLKLATNSFTYEECLFLTNILFKNFNIKATVQSAGINKQYVIYIWKESMDLVKEITKPYIIPSMKYKIII